MSISALVESSGSIRILWREPILYLLVRDSPSPNGSPVVWAEANTFVEPVEYRNRISITPNLFLATGWTAKSATTASIDFQVAASLIARMTVIRLINPNTALQRNRSHATTLEARDIDYFRIQGV